MVKRLKLERDGLDQGHIVKRFNEITEENNELEELGRQYVQDTEAIDRLIENVKNSSMLEESKQKQLDILYKSKRILLENYKSKVEQKIEENVETLEEDIEVIEETKQETQEQKEDMENVVVETGEVSLEENISEQEEMIKWLEKIKTDEAREITRSQKVNMDLLRQIERNKGRYR